MSEWKPPLHVEQPLRGERSRPLVALTVVECSNAEPHDRHVWTPEPRVIHSPKRCPGVKAFLPPMPSLREELEALIAPDRTVDRVSGRESETAKVHVRARDLRALLDRCAHTPGCEGQ